MHLIAALSIVASSTMVSCGLVRPRAQPVSVVSVDPGGVLRVPVARSIRSVRTYATARVSVPLDPEISGAHVYVIAPGRTHWTLVEPTGPHGGPVLDVCTEGVYRLLVCDVQTHGLLPSVGDIAGLRLQVDRTAPRLQLAARLEGDRWTVEFGIDDDLALSEPASLLISDDSGQSWRKVYRALGRRGRLGWRFEDRDAGRIQFSLTATDLAGNGATLQRRLDELGESLAGGERVDSPPNAGEIAHARIARSDFREPEGVGIPERRAERGTEAHSSERSSSFDSRTLWREIHDRGLSVAGGTVLALHGTWDAVFVEESDGTRHELARIGDHSVRVPGLDGDGYRFVVRVEDQEHRSVAVRIDSTPPELTLITAEPRIGGLLVRYRVDDSNVERTDVSLFYRREFGEWHQRALSPAVSANQVVEQLVDLPFGQYEFYLKARDFGGRTVETPARDSALTVRIVRAGPRVAVAKGQCYRGGDRHTLYFERVDPEAIGGRIRIEAISLDDGAAVEIGEVDARTSSRSWRVPKVDGEYRFRLSWHDEQGRLCEWSSDTAFRIDSTPPLLSGVDLELTSGSVTAEFRSSEKIDDLKVWRRALDGETASDSDEWQRVTDVVIEAGSTEESTTVTCVTSTWSEGRWQLGVRARDRAGNRSSKPTETRVFSVDRTPPEISSIAIPSVMVEGVPWVIEGPAGSLPESLAVEWTPLGAPRIEARVPRTVDDGRARFEVSLAPGRGTLRLVALDDNANRSERTASIEVLEAVEEIDVFPRVAVWAGLGARLLYSVRAPHPRAGRSLEMRVARLDGEVLARHPLPGRQGQVQFDVPSEPGSYEVVLAIAGQPEVFRRGHRFIVQSQPSSRRPSVRRQQELNDLLVLFRQYCKRWAERERGAAIDSMRDELIAGFEAAVERGPHLVAHRRAWAALFIYKGTVDLDQARRILRDGFEATDKAKQSLIYDDLSAVESMAGNHREAQRLLIAAINVTETSTRRANLGRVFVNAGNPIRAIGQYLLAMELSPDNAGLRREWLGAIRQLEVSLRERELRSAVERIGRWEAEGRISRRESMILEGLASDGATWGAQRDGG